MTPPAMVGWFHVMQDQGIPIAVTGMLIVFAALVLISLFIAALPQLLAIIAKVLPEEPEHAAPQDRSPSLIPDEAVLAAIGFVLHTELQKQAAPRDAEP